MSFIEACKGISPNTAITQVTKASIKDFMLNAVTSPYIGTPGDPMEDPSFIGRPVIEVMVLKLANLGASGNIDAAKLLLEFLIGKPKQEVETKNFSMTYQDYLSQVASNEEKGVVNDQDIG